MELRIFFFPTASLSLHGSRSRLLHRSSLLLVVELRYRLKVPRSSSSGGWAAAGSGSSRGRRAVLRQQQGMACGGTTEGCGSSRGGRVAARQQGMAGGGAAAVGEERAAERRGRRRRTGGNGRGRGIGRKSGPLLPCVTLETRWQKSSFTLYRGFPHKRRLL